jgi:hypothetical protein
MPIAAPCTAPGCTRVTIGGLCTAHDVKAAVDFVRGRPYVAPQPPPRKAAAAS